MRAIMYHKVERKEWLEKVDIAALGLIGCSR